MTDLYTYSEALYAQKPGDSVKIWVKIREGEKERLQAFAAYYGLVSFLDHNVGRIQNALREEGLADNTLIVFTSDQPEGQRARSGGFHFDYDEGEGRWICDTSEEPLGELLALAGGLIQTCGGAFRSGEAAARANSWTRPVLSWARARRT